MPENKPEKTAATESTGTIVPFSKPAEIAGKERGSVTLDLNSLTGLDLIDAEEQREAFRPGSTSQQLYAVCLAAKSCGCPVDDLLALPAKDFNRLASEVLDFLIN